MTNVINKKPIIWTISGSDCSGGAGIAADIKTGHSLGVEVCSLITANTVQNSKQLLSVNPVPVDILKEQADLLAEDKFPSVIKIGLLVTHQQVVWLTQLLIDYKQQFPNLLSVYDPVGQASVGGSFSALTLEQLTPLLQQVDVITPNLIEAKSLTNEGSDDVEAIAAKMYQHFNISSIIIKGGHSDDKQSSRDFCYHQLNQLSDEKQDNQEKQHELIKYQLSSPRLSTRYSHGGGCSFASALASFLAHGYLMRDAFMLTKAFINQGLASSVQLSESQQHGYYGAFEQLGWPESEFFPAVVDTLLDSSVGALVSSSVDEADGKVQDKNSPLASFPSLNLAGKKLGLYPVIDSLYWLKRLLPLGLEIIQLRVKNVSDTELEEIIKEAVELAKHYNTRLFINDYWQLAIKYKAYGVHIGQEDLQDADLVAIQAAGVRLGISTHGCYEFVLAQQLQPSYLAIGAIFPTKTKDMTGQIQGIDNLTQVLKLRPDKRQKQIPVVAIGGITLERAEEVVATGVESIAVVTAITEAEKSHGITAEQAVTELLGIINDY